MFSRLGIARTLVSVMALGSVALADMSPAQAEPVQSSGITKIVIDLSEQRVFVTVVGGRTVTIPVSTGSPKTPTRVGVFKITSKTRVGAAGGDSAVRMDYFSRFDKGIGFHGIPWRKNRSNRLWTPLGERGVSHGCVRMRDESARWIYEKAPIGTPVVVQR